MSADDEDLDTSRTAVKTYVPAYQKERWKAHADRLGMSQSEFVRTMVQAGRRDFDVPGREDDARPATGQDAGSTAESGDFEDRVRSALSETDHRSWDELLERVAGDIEDRLESTLQELQAANEVQYSGRHGGYSLVSDE